MLKTDNKKYKIGVCGAPSVFFLRGRACRRQLQQRREL
nr:MAG TPA: hypothetical protein [Caudoviricetes sp.]